MLPALLGYPFLSFSERSRISRAALGFKRLDEHDPKTDELRLGDWLEAHGQDERTRRVLWDLFSISSLNVPGDDASPRPRRRRGEDRPARRRGRGRHRRPRAEPGRAARRRRRPAARPSWARPSACRTKVAAIEQKDGQFIVRLGHGVPAQSADGDVTEPVADRSRRRRRSRRRHRRRRRGAGGPARAGRAADPGRRAAGRRRSTAGPASAPPRSSTCTCATTAR